VSFRREAHVSRGGPDGGDGGNGGDLWLVADHDMASLLGFRDHPHRGAGDGKHGAGKARHGASGADLFVPVPCGTVVRDQEGELLVDLLTDGDRWMAARAGQGGRGNARFLSNRRRAPAFAEQGEVGQERWLNMELKLMADAALVGFPNAGKSTLISRISAAKPKIADYPFTTLEPHLGVVRISDGEMVVADIPGLIEGAAEGKGLGHRFLKHVERARVLVVLLDLAAADGTSPQVQLEVLLKELGDYQPDLLDRPRLVVGSKADAAAGDGDGSGTELNRGATGAVEMDLVISSITGAGLDRLVGRTLDLVRQAREQAAMAAAEPVVHRPAPEGFSVERTPEGFVVRGRPAERAVAVNDITNLQALEYVQGRLRRLGVDRALARAGAREGDLVQVGGFSFEYQPD
jgi:GTP-binding protein